MKKFATVTITVLALVLGGCSAHPKRVDCEAHLQPINTPAPLKGPRS